MRVEAGAYGGKVANKEAKDKAAIEYDGEAGAGKKGRAENQSDWKKIRPIIQPG